MGSIVQIGCPNCGYDVEASVGKGMLSRFFNFEHCISICSKCGTVQNGLDTINKCKKCGGDAEIFDERSINDAICPKCHEKIEILSLGLWD